MSKRDRPLIALHEDLPLFREAVAFTAAHTNFSSRLIEKDYYCTLLLAYLAEAMGRCMVFKGGTALAKILADFYRLSDDLEFVIPLPVDATRRQRSDSAAAINAAVARIDEVLPVFDTTEPLRSSNQSTQYNGAVRTHSPITGQPETIRIEVSLREPLLTPAPDGIARTLLLNPITSRPLVPDVILPCISRLEALAEKFRAALTRREPAIRDFFDLDFASQKLGMAAGDPKLVTLVRRKLSVPGTAPADATPERLGKLRGQLDTLLKPALRPADYRAFDLDRAILIVTNMAHELD